MKMTKEKILKAIGNDAWDKIKKLAFGEKPTEEITEATLTDGTEITYEGTLAIGTLVMVVSAEGEAPLPDGEYEMEDGSVFTIKKGAVDSYTPASEAEKESTNPKDAKNATDLKQKIEAMRSLQIKNTTELAAIKKQFAVMQGENKTLRQNLGKISRVLEILVESTPEESSRNRQFARNTTAPSKAERIAAMLKK